MKTIELTGDVGFEITAAQLRDQLPSGREAVLLKVDSYGGSVFEAVRIYNLIRDYPGRVTAELGAVAASAASFFPLAADHVRARSNTTFMIHKAWSFAMGNSDDMKSEAAILDGLDGLLADAYVKKTGYDREDVLASMKDEMWLFGGKDIVAAGFADELVEDSEKEPMEQPYVAMKLRAVRSRLESSERFSDDMKRAAKMVDNPALPDAKEHKEASMDETMTPKAMTVDQPSVETVIAKERERVSALMKLGAKPEDIQNGVTVEEFAVAELSRQREARASVPEQRLGSFNPEPTTPAEAKVVEDSESKFAAVDAIVAKFPITEV